MLVVGAVIAEEVAGECRSPGLGVRCLLGVRGHRAVGLVDRCHDPALIDREEVCVAAIERRLELAAWLRGLRSTGEAAKAAAQAIARERRLEGPRERDYPVRC